MENEKCVLRHSSLSSVLADNNVTEYVELRTGEKLALYVEGTIMSNTDIVSYNEMSAAALKELHNSDIQFNEYDAFGRLDKYEQYCIDLGFTHPQEYLDLRNRLNAMRDTYKDIKHVPCHCDYQPTNLVINGDKLYILDWEFAGLIQQRLCSCRSELHQLLLPLCRFLFQLQ